MFVVAGSWRNPKSLSEWSVSFLLTAVTFSTDVDLELGELLQEFQDVVEELKAPSQSKHSYQNVLHEAKNRTGLGEDNTVEDSDYGELKGSRVYTTE